MIIERERVFAIRNGKAVADSRIFATHFKKAHFNILRDIDQFFADAPPIALDFQAIELERATPWKDSERFA